MDIQVILMGRTYFIFDFRQKMLKSDSLVATVNSHDSYHISFLCELEQSTFFPLHSASLICQTHCQHKFFKFPCFLSQFNSNNLQTERNVVFVYSLVVRRLVYFIWYIRIRFSLREFVIAFIIICSFHVSSSFTYCTVIYVFLRLGHAMVM